MYMYMYIHVHFADSDCCLAKLYMCMLTHLHIMYMYVYIIVVSNHMCIHVTGKFPAYTSAAVHVYMCMYMYVCTSYSGLR